MTRERRYWWHWQNLTADEIARRSDEALSETLDAQLSFDDNELRWRVLQALRRAVRQALKRRVPALHGRAWFYAPALPWRRREHTSLHVEWSAGGRSCRAMFSVAGWGDDSDDLSLSLALPFVGYLYAGVEGILPARMLPKGGRDLGARVFNGSIWLDLWATPDEWSSTRDWRDPSSRLRQPVLHVVDRLLGKNKPSERTIGTVRTALVMPEASYPVILTFQEWTWQRARWPWRKVIPRVDAVLLDPLPIPGKGENGYDCDDDAIYSSTFVATHMNGALSHLEQSTLETRERYGGRDWTPAQEVADYDTRSQGA